MSEQIATRDAYGDAIVELGKQNPNVIVLDADLAKATKTMNFAKAFPERHFDVGIAEMNMAGIAAGLSTCGKIPFISTFAEFGTGRIYDMIRKCHLLSGTECKTGFNPCRTNRRRRRRISSGIGRYCADERTSEYDRICSC